MGLQSKYLGYAPDTSLKAFIVKKHLLPLPMLSRIGVMIMRVLALDPALAHTAAVSFVDSKLAFFEVFDTVKEDDKWLTAAEKDQHRVEALVRQISKWINDLNPDVICAEQPLSTAKSSAALKALSMISGILYTFPEIHPSNKPWVFLRVHDIKQALLNKRRATTKLEVIEAVTKVYPEITPAIKSDRSKTGYLDKAEHIADAIAVYIAFTQTPTYKILEKGTQSE